MLNHEPLRLADGEYRFACLVWDNEPLPSGQLVALAAEGLGWKKSTTYTVLKKLCERGVLQNADGRVTSLIKKGRTSNRPRAPQWWTRPLTQSAAVRGRVF